MKVVFLDVDGVLNTIEGFSTSIDPRLVEQLNAIVKASGSSVVVSSSWRAVGLKRMRELLREAGFIGRVTGVTPVLGFERGLEIQAWIDRCRWTVSHFVILDDNDDMAHLRHRLVHTNPRLGLTVDDVTAAIAMLAAPVEVIEPAVNGATVNGVAHDVEAAVIVVDVDSTAVVVATESAAIVATEVADPAATAVLLTTAVSGVRSGDHAAGLPTTVP